MEQTAAQPAGSILKPALRREPLGVVFAGLLVFLAIYFVRPEDWIPALEPIPLAKIVGILTLLALIFSLKKVRWNLPPEVIFLILLTADLWLTVPFSPVWKWGAFNYALGFSKIVPLVIVMCVAVRSMKRLRRILLVQGISAGIIAVASIIGARSAGGRLQGIISGIYANPNDLAFIIDLTLPLCLKFALTTRNTWAKLAWAITMIAMTYAVVLTASRSGALALGVAALVCVWKLGIKDRRFYVLLSVPLIVTTAWLFAGKSLDRRIEQGQGSVNQSSAGGYEAADSTEQREGLLLESLRVTAKYPLFGVGPGNFQIISGVWRVTHNTYTQVSSEGGIPAFVLYLLILWRAIVNVRSAHRLRKVPREVRLVSMALEASLYTYLAGSFFASVAYQMFPYCVIGYTTAFRYVVQKERGLPRAAPAREPETAALPVEAVVWE